MCVGSWGSSPSLHWLPHLQASGWLSPLQFPEVCIRSVGLFTVEGNRSSGWKHHSVKDPLSFRTQERQSFHTRPSLSPVIFPNVPPQTLLSVSLPPGNIEEPLMSNQNYPKETYKDMRPLCAIGTKCQPPVTLWSRSKLTNTYPAQN